MIIVSLGFMDQVMINPVIVQKSKPYDIEEGCQKVTSGRKIPEIRSTKRKGRRFSSNLNLTFQFEAQLCFDSLRFLYTSYMENILASSVPPILWYTQANAEAIAASGMAAKCLIASCVPMPAF